MAIVSSDQMDELCRAVVVWTGYDSASFPRRDDNALSTAFSKVQIARLLPIVKSLEDDFYKSKANERIASLQEMGQVAASEFRSLHPELPEAIADAFAWCYTFDYK